MSFGFGVGDFLAVLKLVKQVRANFVDAPKQFEAISAEVRSLSIVLQDIEVFASGDEISETQRKELGTILVDCKRTLQDTEKTRDKYCDVGSKSKNVGKTARKVWQRLTFEPADIQDLRSRISSQVTMLNALVSGMTSDNVFKLVQRQDRQEHQEVLDWLTPIDYADQQSDFLSRRQAGTGQWLLDSAEYRQWIATAKQSLFCPGIPGAGKTILTSVIIHDLHNTFPVNGSTAICYLYCNFRRKEEQKLDHLLASLLRQLAQGHPIFPQSVLDLYERHKERRTQPSSEELRNTLHAVAASYSRVFVVVDALDECEKSNGCRSRFISELLNLHAQLGVNLLATSRHIPEIAECFSGSPHKHKEIRATGEDIERYLEGCMVSLPKFVAKRPDLQDEIKEKVVKAADGMFLLAQLHLNSLQAKKSPKVVRAALDGFTTGSTAYDVAYDDAMNRINSQLLDRRELALQALSWITHAKRPLKTLELQHALATEPGEPDFDEENLSDIQDVVSGCCGLVTVDEQTSVVRLVHYTTQEYFERMQNTHFPDGETDITTTCISYLSFDIFKSGRCENEREFRDRLSTYPFYDYSCRNWGHHARLVTNYQWAHTFLEMQTHVDAAVQGLLHSELYDRTTHLTGLHLVAYFGLREATEFFLQVYNRNGRDSDGRTPLSYAAENGHEAVVRLLLEEKAEVDLKDKGGQTPLLYAAQNGHEAVVRLLLEEKAEVDLKDKGDSTPLLYAAENGHEAVVRLLLEEKAEVDLKDEGNSTPLLYAAKNGHEAVVRLLLEEKAEVDLKDESDSTPLSYAAENGHEAVVRLLLEEKAEVDSKDKYGWTPIMYAAEKGREDIVRVLLDKGANANAQTKNGNSALKAASRRGHEKVVQLLLDRGPDLNLGDALVAASRIKWNEEVVQLLLDRGPDLDIGDALVAASEEGNEEVVQLLLDRGPDLDLRGALMAASREGHEKVVQLLLDRGPNLDLGAALDTALKRGHEKVVQLLLDRALTQILEPL